MCCFTLCCAGEDVTPKPPKMSTKHPNGTFGRETRNFQQTKPKGGAEMGETPWILSIPKAKLLEFSWNSAVSIISILLLNPSSTSDSVSSAWSCFLIPQGFLRIPDQFGFEVTLKFLGRTTFHPPGCSMALGMPPPAPHPLHRI